MNKHAHRYFVSYMIDTGTQYSFRNATVSMSRPVTGHAEQEAMVGFLKRENPEAESLVLLSLSKLDTPPTGALRRAVDFAASVAVIVLATLAGVSIVI